MLTLADADTIITAALAEGRARNFAPLTVAVLDGGGHLVAFKREDNSGILRYGIATAKAWGSLGMGFGSREMMKRANEFPGFIGTLSDISGGRIAASPGGVLILKDGMVIGAVGISGDLGPNDEICAVAGIKAAGFSARAEVSDCL